MMNVEAQKLISAMERDLAEADRMWSAKDKLQEAITNYEKVMGVKLKIEIQEDETCS